MVSIINVFFFPQHLIHPQVIADIIIWHSMHVDNVFALCSINFISIKSALVTYSVNTNRKSSFPSTKDCHLSPDNPRYTETEKCKFARIKKIPATYIFTFDSIFMFNQLTGNENG